MSIEGAYLWQVTFNVAVAFVKGDVRTEQTDGFLIVNATFQNSLLLVNKLCQSFGLVNNLHSLQWSKHSLTDSCHTLGNRLCLLEETKQNSQGCGKLCQEKNRTVKSLYHD